MKVNLYATFRLIADTRTLELDLPAGTTVRELVTCVVERLPVLRPHWLDEQGHLHAHVHILYRGDDIATLPLGLDTPLPADAAVDIFPPVAGGCGQEG